MIDEAVITETEPVNQLSDGEPVPAASEAASETDGSFATKAETDYEKIMLEDVAALVAEFPELDGMKSITDLDNPMRYAALRDLGLSPKEAYLATSARRIARDNRAHLKGIVPRAASMPKGTISESELEDARKIFPDLSDLDIRKLYRKVSK